MLILRTCNPDMTAYGGFRWPTSGLVICPDWNPEPHCGNGLHGLRPGDTAIDQLKAVADRKWLVVEAPDEHIVAINERTTKVKFPYCTVKLCSDNRDEAIDYMVANGCDPAKLPFTKVTVGDRQIATAGYGGTATAGYGGTATAGYGGTATAGDRGTATAGYGGTATAGYGGTATAGDRGTATAGYGGTATAGESGTATAGYGGTATAGESGTATAGESGTATAGESGTATAGESGTATAGYGGTATAGYGGTATAGDRGTATAGYGGTATAGESGTATAGESGTATAGYGGTATAGYGGTATAGYGGTATAGDRGIIEIKYVDYDASPARWRKKVGYIGESGLLPNVAYRLDERANFVLKNPPRVELSPVQQAYQNAYKPFSFASLLS